MAVFKLLELMVKDESYFNEYASNPAAVSESGMTNLRILDASVALTDERMMDESAQSRIAKRSMSHKGPRKATLTFSQYLVGHGTDPTGLLVQTTQMKLLGDGLGGYTGGTSGTASGSPSTTSVPYSAGSFPAQGVLRFGIPGDGRAEGQPSVSSSTSTPATLLYALPAAPVSTDAIRTALHAYHVEAGPTVTKRFWFRRYGTEANYVLTGCQLASIKLSNLNPGDKGRIEYTYECAYWGVSTATFPHTSAPASYDCAPVAGGGMLFQNVGTTTRNPITPSDVSLNVNMGLEPILGSSSAGPTSVGPYGYIAGWARTAFNVTCEVTIPWVSTYAALGGWWDGENADITAKQALYWANTGNGRSFGFVLPRCLPTGEKPLRTYNVNGQQYTKIMIEADENTVTTNDMTRSGCVLWAI